MVPVDQSSTFFIFPKISIIFLSFLFFFFFFLKPSSFFWKAGPSYSPGMDGQMLIGEVPFETLEKALDFSRKVLRFDVLEHVYM